MKNLILINSTPHNFVPIHKSNQKKEWTECECTNCKMIGWLWWDGIQLFLRKWYPDDLIRNCNIKPKKKMVRLKVVKKKIKRTR